METGSARRLSAILAADVVGYSRMMGQDAARTLALLRSLREDTLAPAVDAAGGRIVKGLGDGWLVAFDSTTAAVTAARQVQDSLTADAPMRLRIGVHMGDVTFEDGDVYGDGVNIAARLEAIAAPGGIAISETVWSSLDRTHRARFDDAGTHRLKNIADPVRIWAIGGLGAAHGSPQAGAEAHGGATVAITPFIATGRGDDPAALADGLSEDIGTELARFRWMEVMEGEEAGRARYVLGGTVRGAGRRIRLTAHLTFAPTGRRLWSEKWDREDDDIFALQDALTAEVVAHVSPEIDAHEKSLIGARPVHTLTGQELSLRTNNLLATGALSAFDEADALISRAIALDPGNATIHVQKSLVAYRKACSGAWPPAEQLRAGLDAARHALTLDPRQASAYGMLAAIYGMRGETDRALDAADRISALNPNAWGAPHGRSIALAFATDDWITDPAEHARRLIENAESTLRMAPTSSYRAGHRFILGLGLMLRDDRADLSETVATLDRALTEPGATWWPALFLALAELMRGRETVARARVEEARALFPALSLQAVDALFGHTHVGTRWRNSFDRLPGIGLPRD